MKEIFFFYQELNSMPMKIGWLFIDCVKRIDGAFLCLQFSFTQNHKSQKSKLVACISLNPAQTSTPISPYRLTSMASGLQFPRPLCSMFMLFLLLINCTCPQSPPPHVRTFYIQSLCEAVCLIM